MQRRTQPTRRAADRRGRRFLPPALGYPQFVRFSIGLLFSIAGFQVFLFSQFWLAHQLTGSALWLGFVGLAGAIPAILLNLVGGAAADRLDRRRLVIWTEIAGGTVAFGLALLVMTGNVAAWHILIAAGLTAGLNAFNGPARMALYPNYIEREALLSAVAVTTAAWQVMRIVSPALAGLVIAVAGTQAALFVSAAGMFGMAFVMTTLPGGESKSRPSTKPIRDVLEGLQYIRANPLILFLLGMTFFNSFFALAYVPLMPVFAVDILDVGASGQGTLMATSGFGALIVTLWISMRRSNRGKGAFLIGGAMMAGLSLAGFALSSRYIGSFPLAIVLIFAVGVFTSLYMISALTSLQAMVPDHLRGRVMGVWGMTWNILPLGTMFAATLAQAISVPWAVAVGGFAVIAFALGPALLKGEVRSLGRTVDEAAERAIAAAT